MSYDLFKDYLPAINYTKKNLMDSDDPMWKKKYNAFMINKVLSFFSDTIMMANEMNRNYHLDHKLQYDYLMGSIPKGKRFTKWAKNDDENIEIIQKFFGYSFIKAKETLNLLNDTHIELIKLYLNTSKGGKA